MKLCVTNSSLKILYEGTGNVHTGNETFDITAGNSVEYFFTCDAYLGWILHYTSRLLASVQGRLCSPLTIHTLLSVCGFWISSGFIIMMNSTSPIIVSGLYGPDKLYNNSPEFTGGLRAVSYCIVATVFSLIIYKAIKMIIYAFKLYQQEEQRKAEASKDPTGLTTGGWEILTGPIDTTLPSKESEEQDEIVEEEEEEKLEPLADGIVTRLSKCFASESRHEPEAIEVILKITAYITNITCCETLPQYIAATLQLITSIASAEIADFIMSSRKLILEPQGAEDSLTALHQYVSSARQLAGSFFESPLYKFFYDTIGIISISGMCGPELKCGDMIVLSEKYTKEASNVAGQDIISVTLRAVEFGLEAARDFVSGLPMSKFIFGRSAMTYSCELLAKKESFDRGMLEKEHKLTDIVYQAQIRSCLVTMHEYIKVCPPSARMLANTTLGKLVTCEASVTHKLNIAGCRKRPFCVMLCGSSAVGKSSITNEIVNRTGLAFEIPHESENVAVVNETESWDPVTGKTTYVMFDDMCQTNTKAQTMSETPTARFVRYNNVVPSMAIKPEASEKNKIPIQPEVLIITTNVETLSANHYTKCPSAIFNRINVAYRVRPKEYCRKDNGALDVERIKAGECPQEVAELIYDVKDNGSIAVKAGEYRSWEDVLPEMCHKMKEHRAEQEAQLMRFKENRSVTPCLVCFHKLTNCTCPKVSEEEIKEDETKAKELIQVEGLVSWINKKLRRKNDDVRNVRVMIQCITYMSEWIPTLTLKPWKIFENIYTYWAATLFWTIVSRFERFAILTIIMFVTLFYHIESEFIRLLLFIWIFYTLYSIATVTCRSATKFVGAALVEATTTTLGADLLFDCILYSPMIVATLYAGRNMLQAYRSMQTLTNQGNLAPNHMEEVEERHQEKNVWDFIQGEPQTHIVCSNECKTRTVSDTATQLRRIMYDVEAPGLVPGTTVVCVCLRPWGSLLVFPKHSYELIDTSKVMKLTQIGRKAGSPGHVSNVRLEVSTRRDIRQDHVGVLASSGIVITGDWTGYFAESITPGQGQFEIVLSKERRAIVIAQYATGIKTTAATINGFLGKTEQMTYKGDCCSPWISCGKERVIVGLHNGRLNDTVVCETLLRSDFDVFKTMKVEIQGHVIDISPPPPLIDIKTEYFGNDIFGSEEVNERSPTNFALQSEDGRDPIFEVYCDVRCTRVSTESRVQNSVLSDALEQVGIPQQWGKPKFNPNRNFAVAFQQAQHPMSPIDPVALHWAVADYVDPFAEQIRKLGAYFKPLGLFEIMNGRRSEGQKIKAMNMKTSAGIGLTGTKLNHVEVEETEHGNVYTPKDYVIAEYERICDELKNSRRVAPISKGALKDEPTKKTKTKVRLFFVMPMAFLMAGRRVLCPILNLLTIIPLISEQWYGIRTTTDEWAQCFDYISEFGDTGINGDYQAYDQHFSHQLIWYVGIAMTMIARIMGYSEEDLALLRTWFADIANPIYAFNGTLLSFFGYQPSGNPCTVVVNGIGNSLLHRAFFYEGYVTNYKVPPKVGIFRRCVHIGFVGDDSVGGVSQHYPWFNMVNYKTWLHNLGMVYTMPDKTSKVVPYFPMRMVTICKRGFRPIEYPAQFVPDTEGGPIHVTHAPIDPDSVVKSWHCIHKRGEAQYEWLIMKNNLVNGLKELARHPQSVFSYYRDKAEEALKLVVHPPIDEIHYTYDDWQKILVTDYLNLEPVDIPLDEEFYANLDFFE